MLYLKKYFGLLVMSALLVACGGTSSTPEKTSPDSSPPTPPPAVEEKTAPATEEAPPQEKVPDTAPMAPTTPTKEAVYAWVDNLNLRDQPSTSGKVITTVQPDDALQPTGEFTGEWATFTLRGSTFSAPWIRVTTSDGKKGWVFEGAVQKASIRNSKVIGNLADITDKRDRCPLIGGPKDPMDGCSCGLNKEGDRSFSVVDYSFSGMACVRINGQTYQMEGYQDSYSYLKDSPHAWIRLEDDSKRLFGETFDFDYDETVERLTNALLHFDKIPTEVSIDNKMMAGMFVREVRDMAADAIAEAKKRRATGERSGDMRMELSNDQYRVLVTGNVAKGMSDTGTDYEGLMRVMDKSGKVLGAVPIKGHCGC
ncbi:MAG: SH3 domain-containing protein [Bacteroidota bacterium]